MTAIAPTYPWLLMVNQTISALYQEELGRGADDSGRASMLLLAFQGMDADGLRGWLKSSDEWHSRHDTPVPPPVPPAPAPEMRAPLPPLPSSAADKVLPWAPPATRDFLRADAWGVTLPGAPWVPGASSRHPERVLSWFLDRFPLEWRDRWVDRCLRNGYTHVILSAADSMGRVDNGTQSPPGNGQTLDQFVAFAASMKARMPYVTVFLGSKCFQPKDMSAQQWMDYAFPIMDALLAAEAVDEFVPGWEWDLWNVPGATTIQAIKAIGQRAHAGGASCWLHFSPEKTSWFADGEPRGRFGFYDDLGADIDGLMYQTVPIWTPGEMQARLVDTLHQFGTQGNRHKLRMYEDQAALMFDGDRPDEGDANLRGYLACCTIDNVKHTDAKVWGYGNGARMPDGSPL